VIKNQKIIKKKKGILLFYEKRYFMCYTNINTTSWIAL